MPLVEPGRKIWKNIHSQNYNGKYTCGQEDIEWYYQRTSNGSCRRILQKFKTNMTQLSELARLPTELEHE